MWTLRTCALISLLLWLLPWNLGRSEVVGRSGWEECNPSPALSSIPPPGAIERVIWGIWLLMTVSNPHADGWSLRMHSSSPTSHPEILWTSDEGGGGGGGEWGRWSTSLLSNPQRWKLLTWNDFERSWRTLAFFHRTKNTNLLAKTFAC